MLNEKKMEIHNLISIKEHISSFFKFRFGMEKGMNFGSTTINTSMYFIYFVKRFGADNNNFNFPHCKCVRSFLQIIKNY